MLLVCCFGIDFSNPGFVPKVGDRENIRMNASQGMGQRGKKGGGVVEGDKCEDNLICSFESQLSQMTIGAQMR